MHSGIAGISVFYGFVNDVGDISTFGLLCFLKNKTPIRVTTS